MFVEHIIKRVLNLVLTHYFLGAYTLDYLTGKAHILWSFGEMPPSQLFWIGWKLLHTLLHILVHYKKFTSRLLFACKMLVGWLVDLVGWLVGCTICKNDVAMTFVFWVRDTKIYNITKMNTVRRLAHLLDIKMSLMC